jgi:chemotaxis protein methyltransferase CheR
VTVAALPPAGVPPELFSSLRNRVEATSGVVLGDAKLTHLAGVARLRMKSLGISDPLEYLDVLAGERATAELREIVTELLVGETNFYRTAPLFQAFQEAILPGLKDRGQDSPIPVWSAGCATGEEAYSIAIAALEWSRGRHAVPVQVMATDLHPGFLDAARKGIYPAQALREVPDRIKAKYFEPLGEGRYRVADPVRELVCFEQRNLVEFAASPPLPNRYAAVFCRNVMIYFRPETTQRIVARYFDCLVPGGVLFLGHSETLWGISEAFLLEQRDKVFFYRKPEPGRVMAPAGVPPAPRKSGPQRPSPAHPPTAVPSPPPAHVSTLVHIAGGSASRALDRVLEAERLADADRFEDSIRLCREAAGLDPGCLEAEYLLAFLLRGRGRCAEALYHAERILRRDPAFVLAAVEAAECLVLMGKPEEAASRWRDVLRSIDGPVRFPRLSSGAGMARKTLRHYVTSRLSR